MQLDEEPEVSSKTQAVCLNSLADLNRATQESHYCSILSSIPDKIKCSEQLIDIPAGIHHDFCTINILANLGNVYLSSAKTFYVDGYTWETFKKYNEKVLRNINSLVGYMSIVLQRNTQPIQILEQGYIDFSSPTSLLSREKATVFISGWGTKEEDKALEIYLNCNKCELLPEMHVSSWSSNEESIYCSHTEEQFLDSFFQSENPPNLLKTIIEKNGNALKELTEEKPKKRAKTEPIEDTDPIKIFLVTDLGSYLPICFINEENSQEESCRALLYGVMNKGSSIKRTRYQNKLGKYIKSLEAWEQNLSEVFGQLVTIKILFRFSSLTTNGSAHYGHEKLPSPEPIDVDMPNLRIPCRQIYMNKAAPQQLSEEIFKKFEGYIDRFYAPDSPHHGKGYPPSLLQWLKKAANSTPLRVKPNSQMEHINFLEDRIKQARLLIDKIRNAHIRDRGLPNKSKELEEKKVA